MRVLFIENEDSFSWNVMEALPTSRSDILIWKGRNLNPTTSLPEGIHAVVIGPGPTDPKRAGLVEFVRNVVASKTPLLGICLGHQALGVAFGAKLSSTRPVHGKTSTIHFGASRFFGDFEGPQTGMRYHSLVLTEVNAPLRITARTEDGLVMAIEHETLPAAGLQFHPDSYASPRGREMVQAFFRALT